ncbi:MAG: hypothetical protein QM766_04615 [Burkholderiaceae bacterium]
MLDQQAVVALPVAADVFAAMPIGQEASERGRRVRKGEQNDKADEQRGGDCRD